MTSTPTEGWILSGQLDGRATAPDTFAPVAGLPHVLRLICTLKAAGVERVFLVWLGPDEQRPDRSALAALAADPRVSEVAIDVVTQAPPGPDHDRILIVRGDRVFHRSIPQALARASESAPQETASAVTIAGPEYDAAVSVPRELARELVQRAAGQEGMSAWQDALGGRGQVIEVEPPWRGFSMPARQPKELRRAEWHLVTSLRKPNDGIVSRWMNRPISLALTRLLCSTSVSPNHITGLCFVLALAGGVIMASGGYIAAVIGIVLFELGSILDGVDGELSRLKYLGSKLGEWLDTLCDDFANVLFIIGATSNLHMSGSSWALPLGVAALIAFLVTQSTQYYLMVTVYKTGDLMAVPWAAATRPHSGRQAARGSTSFVTEMTSFASRLLKRDFFITLFVVLIIAHRLDLALLLFAFGGLSFAIILPIQLLRIRLASARPQAK